MSESLARLALLKSNALMKETESTWDDELMTLLRAATQTVERFTARSLQRTTVGRERYGGNGTGRLYLREWPVLNVLGVWIWDGSDSYDLEDPGYYELIDERWLQYPRLGQEAAATYAAWPADWPYGIQVSYRYGYLVQGWTASLLEDPWDVPYDLELATARVAYQMWLDGKKGGHRFGLTQMAQGPESVAVDRFIRGFPEDVVNVLMRYRRML